MAPCVAPAFRLRDARRAIYHPLVLDRLTLSDFAGCVGQPFRLLLPSSTLDLVLTEAEALRGKIPGQRQPFSLVFRGPATPALAQRIHRLEHPGLGALDLFLVPIGPDAQGPRYQAIFA